MGRVIPAITRSIVRADFFTAAMLFVATVLLVWPHAAMAASCQPQLHNDIAVESGSLMFADGKNEFKVAPNGALFFSIHPVSLSDEQKAALKAYSKTVRNDLPYISQSLRQELKTSWQALDGVLVKELGESSSLRGELGQFHRYLQTRVDTAMHDEKSKAPRLDHLQLLRTVSEIEASLPQFIATVTSRGLMDIAGMSVGKENKLQFISQKMASLQKLLSDEVKTQRLRTEPLRQELCQRLAVWQQQEETIQKMIPALGSWKSVTVR